IATGGLTAVQLWDAETGRSLWSLPSPQARSNVLSGISGLAFSPDGKWLASYHRDQKVRIALAGTGNTVRELERPGTRVPSAVAAPYFTLLPGGKQLLVARQAGA